MARRTLSDKIRVPGLVEGAFPPAPRMSLPDSIQLVTDFLRRGKGETLIMTGAGVSVDSGIRAYRGPEGTYTIRKHRPIFYGEFIAEEHHRRRYWARSYLGYPPVRVAESNPTHYAMAALMKMGYVKSLITQNVDGLHHKAHSSDLSTYLSPPSVTPPSSPTAPLPALDPPILELHGTLRHAHCLACHTPTGRDAFQDRLSALNPAWHAYSREVESGEREEKLNPDGDIELGPDVRYEEFEVPACDRCGGPMKPRVIFFGESLEPVVKRQSHRLVDDARQVLVAGSSLATFSAYRLVRQAKDQGKPVGLVNVGETRADSIVDWRVGWQGGAGPVFTGAVQELLKHETKQSVREEVEAMMAQGKIKKLPASMRAAS
ncbi:hypothetical protein JCM10212_001040 [Sporobolomyces blumeae]